MFRALGADHSREYERTSCAARREGVGCATAGQRVAAPACVDVAGVKGATSAQRP
jgi:hypothetical protein